MKNGQVNPSVVARRKPCGCCWKPTTKKQKDIILALLVVAVLLLVIGLFYLVFAVKIEICTSAPCVKTSTEILKYIDAKADPCDDFYRFSCGNFLQNTNLDNRGSRSVQDIMEDEIQSQIRNMLELPIQLEDSRGFNLAKKFYRACMNESAIEAEGLKKMKQIFKQIGGWPTLEGNNWRENEFSWIEAVHKLRRMGVNYDVFFRVTVDKDETDNGRYILGIHDTWYRPSELSDEMRKLYIDYMVELAVLFGANSVAAKRDAAEVLNIFLMMAKLSKESEITNNKTSMSHRLALSELQYKYPTIRWYQFINGLLKPAESFTYDDEVIVTEPIYLKKLESFLNYTPKRSLANFISWHTLQYLINYLPAEVLDKAYQFLEKVNRKIIRLDTPRWKTCVKDTGERMSPVISAAYMQHFLNQDFRYKIIELIQNVKIQFKFNLLRLEWLEKETKMLILEKLLSSVEEIASYGDWLRLLNENRIYQEVEIHEGKYLESLLNLDVLAVYQEFSKLKKPVDDHWLQKSKFLTGFTVQYSPKKNALTFPIGIFRGIYYHSNRPEYMNYGILGSIIAHEISHIFVKAEHGVLPGELRSSWSPNSLLNYDGKLRCLSNQYGNFVVTELEKHLNTLKTRDEDMADLAGLKISYDTYINWVQENGAEPLLPGLNYSPNQLFWISSAIRHCAKYSTEVLERYIDNYQWSPQQFRVNGPLQNLNEFAFDFGCKPGSKMNPVNKCVVW